MSVPLHKRKESDMEVIKRSTELRKNLILYFDETIKFNHLNNIVKTNIFNNLYDNMNNIINNIVRANSIWPTCDKEATQRRLIQNVAISYCYALKQDLIILLHLSKGKEPNILIKSSEELDNIIKMLKKWRLVNNKYFNQN